MNRDCRKPNFFIIGAPKCGTTSLWYYLRQHPQAFLPALKEPLFFNTDMQFRRVTSHDRYSELFEPAEASDVAVGEASAWYLYSRTAVPNILSYNLEARFIALLRNPVELVLSLHAQRVYNLEEDTEDLSRAWFLQEERRAGRRVPRFCRDPKMLLYGDVARLGEQVERLFATVPRERILLVILEDLVSEPEVVYDRVCSFLGLSTQYRQEFPVLNTRKYFRSRSIQTMLGWAMRVKQLLGIERSLRLLVPLRRLNTTSTRRIVVPEPFITYLHSYFRDDVLRLSTLMGRDLSHWLKETPSVHH